MAAARARCVAPAALQGQAAASASAATAAAPAPSPATTQAQPDLVFDLEGVDTKIHVFGVEHTHPQAHVGELLRALRATPCTCTKQARACCSLHAYAYAHAAEFIYRLRPSALVVETAVTPEHGSRPGNTITCRDRMIEGPQAFYMRMFCKVCVGVCIGVVHMRGACASLGRVQGPCILAQQRGSAPWRHACKRPLT